MPSIRDGAAVRRAARPITRQQYHALADANLLDPQVELLRGVIVAKMPKSPQHASFVRKRRQQIELALPHGWLVTKEDPLALGDSEPAPDRAVVPGGNEDDRETLPTSAALVVEVAASSLAIDRPKGAIHADRNVPEYWIVRPGEVEIYRHPQEPGYAEIQVCGGDDVLAWASLPGMQVGLREFFTGSPPATAPPAGEMPPRR